MNIKFIPYLENSIIEINVLEINKIYQLEVGTFLYEASVVELISGKKFLVEGNARQEQERMDKLIKELEYSNKLGKIVHED